MPTPRSRQAPEARRRWFASLCRHKANQLGQTGAERASSAPENARGGTRERPASASQPLGPHHCWPAISGVFSIQVCKALSDRIGMAAFAESGQQGSLVAPDGSATDNSASGGGGSSSASAQTVEATTLDATIPPPLSVFLLKLDLQGGEVNALLGASRLLSDARRAPRYLYIEFDPLCLQRASTSAAICRKQPPRGFGQFSSTPHQRQTKLRAATSLGQPQSVGRCVLAGRSYRHPVFDIGANALLDLLSGHGLACVNFRRRSYMPWLCNYKRLDGSSACWTNLLCTAHDGTLGDAWRAELIASYCLAQRRAHSVACDPTGRYIKQEPSNRSHLH